MLIVKHGLIQLTSELAELQFEEQKKIVQVLYKYQYFTSET